jgi:GNAT superfamily N-acetyltransferase
LDQGNIVSTPTVQVRHDFVIVSDKNESISTCTITRTNGVLWLTNVWTHADYRKRGYSKMVISTAIKMFGSQDIYLHVSPYTDMPVSEDALERYYETFGFEITKTPGIMLRYGTK